MRETHTYRMGKCVNILFFFWNDSNMHVSLHVMYTILHKDFIKVPRKTTLISITCSQTVLLLQSVTAFTNAHIYLCRRFVLECVHFLADMIVTGLHRITHAETKLTTNHN